MCLASMQVITGTEICVVLYRVTQSDLTINDVSFLGNWSGLIWTYLEVQAYYRS